MLRYCPRRDLRCRPSAAAAARHYGFGLTRPQLRIDGKLKSWQPACFFWMVREGCLVVAMVLFNIGWMNRYRGDKRADRLINGGKYVLENGTGGEVENFLPRGGRCRGCVRLPSDTLRLEHLGGSPDAPYVDGATVVFSATRPGGVAMSSAGTATPGSGASTSGANPYGFIAEARAEDSTLLDVDDRVFAVPRTRAGAFGLGQSNVRYLYTSDAARS